MVSWACSVRRASKSVWRVDSLLVEVSREEERVVEEQWRRDSSEVREVIEV